LCKELRDAYQRSEDHPGDRFPFTDRLINRADAALATPPARPIVPLELIQALEVAAEALRVVDAGIVLADDIAGAQACAANALPRIRRALQTCRNYATTPAATREAVPLPQAGAEISDEEIDQLESSMWETTGVHEQGQLEQIFNYRAFARAVLARWGGAAIAPVPVSKRLPGAKDLDAANRCWWFAESHEGRDTAPTWAYTWHGDDDTHWLPHWALPVPAAGRGEGQA
jgi:hypothetical protein